MKPTLNYSEVTPAQYSSLLDPPVSASTIRRRCEKGLLNAYRTEGGHWKIIMSTSTKDDTKNDVQLELALKRNAHLKTALTQIVQIGLAAINGDEIKYKEVAF